MKSFIHQLFKNEEGQSLVFATLLMFLLLGFAALVIDIGMMQVAKREMQTSADAAALAGAQELPDVGRAKTTAISYSSDNGAEKTNVNPAYGVDSNQIEVISTKNVEHAFARILGFSDGDVTARAVAKKQPSWAGEALPFVNLDDLYAVDSKIVAWEKTGPGDFESIWKDEYKMFNLGKKDDHSKGYFTIDYEDGITITKGTVATIKQEIGYIYAQGKPVYIFSLSNEVINSGKYKSKLKNKDVIPLSDLVLLQVTFDSYDASGKSLYLTVKKVFNFNAGEYPTEYLHTSGTTVLVE